MSSIQASNIRKRLTNIFSKDPQSNLYQITEGIGTAFDAVDPGQIKLSQQFSVTTATDQALDRHGADHELPRRAGEDDETYRARILSLLPVYAQGPTPDALIASVTPFTGTAPTYNERGQNPPYVDTTPRWNGVSYTTFPISFPFMFGAMYTPTQPPGGGIPPATTQDYFTIDVTINNPNSVQYQRQDVIQAVKNAKRSIALVIIHWEDSTTSTVW